ncbi:MAG: phage protein Gp36 family protein [bacterium]
MAWIPITEDDVKTRLAGAELAAYKSRALAAGQADPLPEIIEQTVDEIRGYIAVRNTLQNGVTIPSKLKSAALALIVYRVITRLPVSVSRERTDENTRAEELLKLVADGKFRVEEATTPSTEASGSQSPMITPRTRTFDRDSQDGI